ncbi:MAG: hypothetical protein K0V04_29125 [Deltaproteobacteria bacterium]|nr:hypothetical protein [Deltaproteobacteria bacterium]
MPTFAESCALEITSLHGFFEHWFHGGFADRDSALERFSQVLAPGFAIVSPSGVVTHREPLIERLSAGYGAWAGDSPKGSIAVEAIDPRHVHGEVGLLTYIERHRRPSGDTARLSTVLMQRREGSPNGVWWLHLQETWMAGSGPR